MSICIFRRRPLALALAPSPAPVSSPGRQFLFTGPGPHFVFTGPCPKSVFTGPGPKFLLTGPGRSGAWACIYQPCSLDLFLLALAYDFYYRALNLHLPSIVVAAVVAAVILAIEVNFFGLDNTNISIPILVN